MSNTFLQELFLNTSHKLLWPASPAGFSVEVGVAERTRPSRESRYVISIDVAPYRNDFFEICGHVFTKYADGGRITAHRAAYVNVHSEMSPEILTEELNYIIWYMRGVCARVVENEERARRKGTFR